MFWILVKPRIPPVRNILSTMILSGRTGPKNVPTRFVLKKWLRWIVIALVLSQLHELKVVTPVVTLPFVSAQSSTVMPPMLADESYHWLVPFEVEQ